ncbi:rRNA-processing protein FYV7-like [Anopheles merus]|nr:rRNA-processing protein FYV7-like [Anopheles merus]XP_041782048.1 rRNA-processing protein FYV7-like [Anopheles merus]
MKTDNKSHSHRPKGGGQRNRGIAGQGKRKDKFFLDVPKSENKPYQQQRNQKDGGGGSGNGRPSGKRGPGVQKTVAFKPKQQGHRQGGDGQKPSYNKNNPNSKHTKYSKPPGGRPPGHKGKSDGRKGGGAPQPFSEPPHFEGKPEKVNYCLAPDRLEAQARAIKQIERQEREAEFERRKQDRQLKHKKMTQKTRKGQPVMQGRLEMLFEKVKKVVGVQ